MNKDNDIDPNSYLPLVRLIVDRLDVKMPSHWNKEDVIGYGVLGLMEAIGRFQPDKGVQFATFASKRIRGAILDALRRDSPLSRNSWQKVQLITEAMERIAAHTDKEVSIEDISKEVDMGRDEIEEVMQSFQLMASVSLEQTLGFDELTIKDTLRAPEDSAPDVTLLKKEQLRCLSEAIATLEERPRLILTLYYYEELNLKEIAGILEVSVSRVSQLKTMALAELRSKMELEASGLPN